MFAFNVNVQEGQAGGVDDLVSLLHPREFEGFLGLAAFAGADAVAEGFVDLEHVGKGVVAAVFEFEQKGGAGVHGVVAADEEIAGSADRSILLAEHPQTRDRGVGVGQGSARHGNDRLETGVERGDIHRAHPPKRHAGGANSLQRKLAGEAAVGALVPER